MTNSESYLAGQVYRKIPDNHYVKMADGMSLAKDIFLDTMLENYRVLQHQADRTSFEIPGQGLVDPKDYGDQSKITFYTDLLSMKTETTTNILSKIRDFEREISDILSR